MSCLALHDYYELHETESVQSTHSTYGEVFDSTFGFLSLLDLSVYRKMEDGWDGNGSVAPSGKTLFEAEQIIKSISNDSVFSRLNIHKRPFVSVDSSSGEICLEWWNQNKRLSVFILDDEVSFIQSWGTDVHNEMVDGEITDNLLELFLWLENI